MEKLELLYAVQIYIIISLNRFNTLRQQGKKNTTSKPKLHVAGVTNQTCLIS